MPKLISKLFTIYTFYIRVFFRFVCVQVDPMNFRTIALKTMHWQLETICFTIYRLFKISTCDVTLCLVITNYKYEFVYFLVLLFAK